MTYDNWKTTNPEDARRGEVPCEENPKLDDYDVCLWCGADPTEACKWNKPL